MPTATQDQASAQSTLDARKKFVENRFAKIQLAAFDILKASGATDDDASKGAESVGSFCGLNFPSTEISDVAVTSKGMTVWTAGNKVSKVPPSGSSILFHRAYVFARLRSLGVDVKELSFRD